MNKKAYNTKPSMKQKVAVKKIIENHGNVSKAMKEAGYQENTIKNPSNLTNSKGFKQLCNELGLTEELITTALVDDIKLKPQNRKAELELASKLLGLNESKIKIETDQSFIPRVVMYNTDYKGQREPKSQNTEN